MAAKADFTEDEWKTLHKGVTGAGLLVSTADPGFMDSFGEASALAKRIVEDGQKSDNQLVKDLAATGGTGFGLTSSREHVESETMDALHSSVALLEAKAPDDAEPYRRLVLDVAQAVAEAKGGVAESETAAIDTIKQALGAS